MIKYTAGVDILQIRGKKKTNHVNEEADLEKLLQNVANELTKKHLQISNMQEHISDTYQFYHKHRSVCFQPAKVTSQFILLNQKNNPGEMYSKGSFPGG